MLSFLTECRSTIYKLDTLPINHGKHWSREAKIEAYQLALELKDDDDLFNKLANHYGRTSTSVKLIIREIAREKFIKSRNIEKLIHFTDARNIESIQKNGLISIDTLNKKNMHYYNCDDKRLDGITHGISISITKRNDYLFQAYHRRQKREWIEIELDPYLLCKANCYFFDTNAANKKFINRHSELENVGAFISMFSDEVTIQDGRKINRINQSMDETTCSQAEIIVKYKIPKSKIIKITKINVS
jgi:hypothetical protein